MQTLQIELEDNVYANFKKRGIDLQEVFKQFILDLTDDGYPKISTSEAKIRIFKAVQKYKTGIMETVSHDDMWAIIDSDCEKKLENRV